MMHAKGWCTACGQWSMVALSKATRTGRGNSPRTSWPRCRITPGCAGHHLPRQRDIDWANDKRWDHPAPFTTPRPPEKSEIIETGGLRWQVKPNGHRILLGRASE